jgi:hypothetical protein
VVLELVRKEVKCGMGQELKDQYDLYVESELDLGVDSKWEENWNLTSNSSSSLRVRASIGFSILVFISPHFHLLFCFLKQAS